MDNWLPAHRKADGNEWPLRAWDITPGPIFPSSSRWPRHSPLRHLSCSVMGPTWPNRMYWMTGTIDPEGRTAARLSAIRRPRADTPGPRSRKAGKSGHKLEGLSATGQLRLQSAGNFQSIREADARLAAVDEGMVRGAGRPIRIRRPINDRLPAVSWIIPTSYQSEHPDYMPADGAAFVASKIDAIAANPGGLGKDGLHSQL